MSLEPCLAAEIEQVDERVRTDVASNNGSILCLDPKALVYGKYPDPDLSMINIYFEKSYERDDIYDSLEGEEDEEEEEIEEDESDDEGYTDEDEDAEYDEDEGIDYVESEYVDEEDEDEAEDEA